MRFNQNPSKNSKRPSTRKAIARRSHGIRPLEGRTLCSATYFVSLTGSDANAGTDASQPWRTVQHAFDAATPGSTVNVLAGRYHEKLIANVSGNAVDGAITFQAVGKVFIDGKGVAGQSLLLINNQNYLRIVGFDFCNNLKVNDGAAIRLFSADDHIEILNNRICKITGANAMAITVFGSDPVAGISNLTISGNEVHHCMPFPGEAISINGNVHDFYVTSNYVHDVNGIGIDVIGGEGISLDPLTDVPHNGSVIGNRVTGARAPAHTREAVGIMVDGAHDIVVAQNVCWNNQVGIEVGAVRPAMVATNDIVRDNLIFKNRDVGLSLGGTDITQGRVQNCTFTNNTLYHNGSHDADDAQIRVQWASNNKLENNLIVGCGDRSLITVDAGAENNSFDYNLFYAPAGASRTRFIWNGQTIKGFSTWKSLTLGDANSVFAAPVFASNQAGYLRLAVASPGVNWGDPMSDGAGEVDLAGQTRVLGGRIDIGAYEVA